MSLNAGDIVATRYRLEGRLGEGGMAEVWRAIHTETDRVVALKVIRKELVTEPRVREMFVREARIAARIGKSDNIVDVLDAGIDDALGVPFIAMELLDGETLDVRLRRDGPLAKTLALELFESLGEALDQAHTAGVVHRDLKPQNLFLARDRKGRLALKVLDFGIAKLADTAQQSSTTVGTPAYSAPEQLGPSWRAIAERQGKTIRASVSPQTDLWAMGLVVYEALTGAPSGELWGATTLAELPVKMVLEPTPLASNQRTRASMVPPGFDAWLARCLEIDAQKRFASAGEAMRALRALLEIAPSTSAPTSPSGLELSWQRTASSAAHPNDRQGLPAEYAPPPQASQPPMPHPSVPYTTAAPGVPSPRVHVPTTPPGMTAPPGWATAPNTPIAWSNTPPPSPALATWAHARGVELRNPDMRAYDVWQPFEFLPRIGHISREVRFALHDAQVLIGQATAKDELKRAIGEDGFVVAIVNSSRIAHRVAIRSKQSAGIADGVTRGLKLMSSLIEIDKRSVTLGDPRFEQAFEIASPSAMEANAGLPFALRRLLIDGNFRGIMESRPGGFAISFFEMKRFEPLDIDRIMDAIPRIYLALTG